MSNASAAHAFRELVARTGPALPLDRATAWLAAEENGTTEIQHVLVGLDELAAGARVPAKCNRVEAVARIHHHLFADLGFCGDDVDYDHPDNSLIDRVLDRRRGLPILLSVVYMEVARRCGLDVAGIGFPGHFLVQPLTSGNTFFVDPFRGGAIALREQLEAHLARLVGGPVTPEQVDDALQPVTPLAMLVRMNNNLRHSYLRRGELAGALRCLDRLVVLAPGWPELRRDRGMLLAQLGAHERAIEDLQQYLAMRPAAPDASRIGLQLSMLLRR